MEKQDTCRLNELRRHFICVIKLTKLSTYYVRKGVRGDPGLNVIIWSLYIVSAKSAQYSPTNIVTPTRFRPHGPFGDPLGPLVVNDTSAYLGQNGFHMAFESWKSVQQSPRKVPDKFGPNGHCIVGPRGLYTLWKVVPMNLKTFLCESSGNVCAK